MHGDEGEVTAMTTFFGNKGGNSSIMLVGVAHKSKHLTLPSAKVYNKINPQPYNIVLSHLSIGGKIISMCFFNRAKYIAILVEIEPRAIYHLAICGISGSSDVIYKEDLKGNYSKLSNSTFDSSTLTLSSDKQVKVYATDKSGGVTYSIDKSDQINTEIVLEKDDYIVDQCWLKNEAKLFITTTRKIYSFDSCLHECTVQFEFPAIELKSLINDKILHEKPDKEGANSDYRAKQGIYHSVDYLISYLNPSGGDSSKQKMPEFLRFAIEQEIEANHSGVSFDGLREEARRSVLKQIYSQLSRKIVEEKGIKISCICRQESGFAVGFRGIGMIAVFKRKRDSYSMESCSVMKHNNYDIWCMSGSFDDSRIVVTAAFYKFSSDERIAEKLSTGIERKPDSIELAVFQSNIVGTIKNSAMEPFEFLYPFGSHSQAITNCSVIPTKSFAATISKDLSFKLWQYNGDQKQLMSFVPNSYSSDSSKHDLAMDMHPLAVQVAIGLKDGFRVYYLVEGLLSPAFQNFTKHTCYAVAYSSRGQYLAAGFINEVLIYDPYSFTVINTIKSSVDGVKSLEWTGRDRYLVTLCNSSYFSITDSWNEFSVKIDESKMSKPLGKMTALTYDPEFELLVCCCPDQVLRIYNCLKEEFHAECDNSANGIIFTSVLLSKKLGCIFFGTQTGAVRVYLWPFSDQKKQSFDSTQCLIHTGPVTSIRVTPSMEHLVTTSVDGTLFFLRIKERVKGNDVGAGDTLGALVEQKDTDLLHRLSNTYSLNEFTYMSTLKQKVVYIITPRKWPRR
jgi:WD40 repeat protein